MANEDKHKKNPVSEWLGGEEGTVPTQSRGSHVVDSYIKKGKPALREAPAHGGGRGSPESGSPTAARAGTRA